MAHTIVNTDGDRWRFLRNTLLSTFSPAKMRMVSVTWYKPLPVVQLSTINFVQPSALENLWKKQTNLIYSKGEVIEKNQNRLTICFGVFRLSIPFICLECERLLSFILIFKFVQSFCILWSEQRWQNIYRLND